MLVDVAIPKILITFAREKNSFFPRAFGHITSYAQIQCLAKIKHATGVGVEKNAAHKVFIAHLSECITVTVLDYMGIGTHDDSLYQNDSLFLFTQITISNNLCYYYVMFYVEEIHHYTRHSHNYIVTRGNIVLAF